MFFFIGEDVNWSNKFIDLLFNSKLNEILIIELLLI